MNSSNTGKDKNKTEHLYCGTDDCCQMCDTAIGDTPPLETQKQLSTKYTQRDWDRTVGTGKVPEQYRKK
jgi:hypothetical protein